MLFKNKTVVVTGGTRGIGAEMVKMFSSNGAMVIYTGTDSSHLRDLQKTTSGNTKYVPLNLDDDVSVESFIEYLDRLGSIDVLVNNAGINRIDRAENIASCDFEAVMNVNVKGPFYISQKVCKMMMVSGGHIVNIGSIWSTVTKEGRASYSTSKAAIAGLTRALAVDFASHGILVNTVSPGFTATELTYQSLSPSEVTDIEARIPCQRMAKPEEIAELVFFLASTKNTYITGQNFLIDGGYSIV
jgi:NAD(P)-dependent dehydrogenase (short-subunit alcohol dehydrogenase family)